MDYIFLQDTVSVMALIP